MNRQTLQRLFGLEGATTLVTGSSRGIGLALATALGEADKKTLVHCQVNFRASAFSLLYRVLDVSPHCDTRLWESD